MQLNGTTIVVVALGSALALSGCSTTGTGGSFDGGLVDAPGGNGGSGGGGAGRGGSAGSGASGSGGSGANGGSSGSGGSGGSGATSCAPDVDPTLPPAPCGSVTCGLNQVCIHPCCGGAPPQCLPPLDGGACPSGSSPGLCFSGEQGCVLDPCNPPPPYCADVGELECACTAGGTCRHQGTCFGYLQGRDVSCTCA